jgi:hypothetical protein
MLDGPYWRILIRPALYNSDRVPFAKLLPTLQQAQVLLRGWDFPHLSHLPEKNVRETHYVGTWDNFGNYEYWRFYESAQLIHYHGVREQVDEGYRQKLEDVHGADPSATKGYIDITNFLYTVTEAFVFAARLATLLRLDEIVHIELALRGITGFILGFSEHGRSLRGPYQWNGGELSNWWDVEARELKVDPGGYALKAVVWFFERFGWEDVNQRALADAQAVFLRRQR